jgi:hypothetical protein
MPPSNESNDTQHSLLMPISTLVLGIVFIVAMFSIPPDRPQAQTEDDPTATLTATVYTIPEIITYPDGTPTPTETPTNTPEATDEPDPTATDEPASDDDDNEPAQIAPRPVQPSRTPTNTRPVQATRTTRAAEPTRTPEPEEEEEDTPTPTDTGVPTDTPEPNTRTCVRGAVTVIEGIGPPNTPLIAVFGERPVGGATTDSEGVYQLPITVGEERPGDYLLQIRVRSTRQVVRELRCIVPTSTPTREPFIPAL